MVALHNIYNILLLIMLRLCTTTHVWYSNGLQISNHVLESDAALVSVASVAWPAEPEELLSAEADAALLRGLFLELEPCLDWLAEGGAGAFSTLPAGVSAGAAPSTSQHMTDHMHSHLTTCMCI